MNRNVAVVGVGALVCGIGLGYALFGWRETSEPSRAEVGTGQSTTGERKVLYWHDPMVPGARYDKPGKSPFMDMQLVPVYADDAAGGGVRIDANVAQNLGIRLGRVERTVITHRLSALGDVTFDERLLEVVQARVGGNVTRLYVRAPLERVRRGQPLADILSSEWLAAQQEYLALLDAQSDSVVPIRNAARQRLTVLGVPDTTIRAIETDRTTRPTTTITAPIEGVISELAVREGSAFMAGAALFRINALDTVWVNAQVPEAQVSMVPTGATVAARATAWPGESFAGRVIALLPDVNPQTRTLTARVELKNPNYKLAPGMYVSLTLSGRENQPQLVVPSEAVIMTGERAVVIVARQRGGFDVADVMVGAEADGKTAILAGLEEGQAVVLSGQFLIDSEASLSSAVNRLQSTQEQPR